MTVPNHGMFEAMKKATLGDDVYGEGIYLPFTQHFYECS